MYEEGDFILRFVGCELDPARNCEEEMKPYYEKWKKARDESK